jgi:hypothetical protein
VAAGGHGGRKLRMRQDSCGGDRKGVAVGQAVAGADLKQGGCASVSPVGRRAAQRREEISWTSG